MGKVSGRWEPVLVVILYKDRSQERHLNKYHMTPSGKKQSHIQVTFSKIKLHLFPGTGGLFVLMQYYSAQVARTSSELDNNQLQSKLGQVHVKQFALMN